MANILKWHLPAVEGVILVGGSNVRGALERANLLQRRPVLSVNEFQDHLQHVVPCEALGEFCRVLAFNQRPPKIRFATARLRELCGSGRFLDRRFRFHEANLA